MAPPVLGGGYSPFGFRLRTATRRVGKHWQSQCHPAAFTGTPRVPSAFFILQFAFAFSAVGPRMIFVRPDRPYPTAPPVV